MALTKAAAIRYRAQTARGIGSLIWALCKPLTNRPSWRDRAFLSGLTMSMNAARHSDRGLLLHRLVGRVPQQIGTRASP